MGLLSKIAQAVIKPQQGDSGLQKELQTLNKDGRLHARYAIHGEGIAMLKLHSDLSGTVKDISYGGLAARFNAGSPEVFGNPTAQLTGSFVLLDRRVDLRLTPVRVVSQGAGISYVGFSIHHESPDTLVFLRDLIEPLKSGRSLAPLGADLRNDRYRGPEWACYRGEGPTDLILKTTPTGTDLEEALLTFRVQDGYCEVSFKNGQVKTGRSISKPGMAPGQQMAPSTTADPALLRQAIYTLMASPVPCRKVTRALVKECMGLLNVPYTDVAA